MNNDPELHAKNDTLSAAARATSTETQEHTIGTRQALQDLYPTPKTYEQRRQDVIERQIHYAKKRPKFPLVKASFTASLLFYIALVLGKNLEILWVNGGIPGVSLSFGVVIGLCIGGYLCARFIRELFYAWDAPIGVFAFLYGASAIALFISAFTGVFGMLSGTAQLLLIAGFHFTVMLLLLKITLRGKGVR